MKNKWKGTQQLYFSHKDEQIKGSVFRTTYRREDTHAHIHTLAGAGRQAGMHNNLKKKVTGPFLVLFLD